MVPIYVLPLDETGERAHADDTFTFSDSGVLIGAWTENGADVLWDLGETVHLDFTTQSTRGAMEPALIELSEPGHFLMFLRASNYKQPDMPSYKWKAVSTDYCRTWSEPEPFTYADGEPFFSPSACSVIMRSSKDGKIYWFGNISPENASHNYPRFPLVVGVLDEASLG